MRDYDVEMRARQPFVTTLFQLGFTLQDIAHASKWCIATVGSDIQRQGGLRAFPDRPKPTKAYSTILKHYAALVVENSSDNVAMQIREALAMWLKQDTLLATIEGMICIQRQLLQPCFPPDQITYARLIEAMYKSESDSYDTSTSECHLESADFYWNSFLLKIRQGQIQTPNSHTKTTDLLAISVLDGLREKIMPIWTSDVCAHIDEMLSSINPREAVVLRCRFGLSGQRLTLEETGVALKITRERIRQIELEGLRSLHHRLREECTDLYMTPVGNMLAQTINKHRAVQRVLDPHSGIRAELFAHLTKRTNALNISTRVRNCLNTRNIYYVGELVQQTKHSLLKQRNFGRRSLRDITNLLTRLGLHLGTDPTSPAIRAFEAWKIENLP